MITKEEITEQNILNKFKMLLFHNTNSFFMRRAFANTLRECEIENIDYLPLLRAAINSEKLPSTEGIERPEIGLYSDEQLNKVARKCKLCGHKFEMGENAWKGYKKVCKEPCTLKNLEICG